MSRKRPTRHSSEDNAWHLDRKVPLALIMAIIVQGAVILSWANTVTYSLSSLKGDVEKLQVENKERSIKMDQLISLQADVKNLVGAVERIERYVLPPIAATRKAPETR